MLPEKLCALKFKCLVQKIVTFVTLLENAYVVKYNSLCLKLQTSQNVFKLVLMDLCQILKVENVKNKDVSLSVKIVIKIKIYVMAVKMVYSQLNMMTKPNIVTHNAHQSKF